MALPIPRFLLPRGHLLFRSLQRRQIHISPRHCKEKPRILDKSRILEKPAKFNPPSHGARLPTSRRPQQTYGAPLTETQKIEQANKQYPRMMPPKGSFMHWFLTNRAIHLWITLVRLEFPQALTKLPLCSLKRQITDSKMVPGHTLLPRPLRLLRKLPPYLPRCAPPPSGPLLPLTSPRLHVPIPHRLQNARRCQE